MNQDFECLPQHQNGPPTDQQKLASERAATLRDEEWQLHNECITLAREALEHYKAQGEKRLRIPDLARIIDLASRLGRLATGIPTEHIDHAWSDYRNDFWTAQFLADLHKIYGQPVEAGSEELPPADENRSADFSRPVGTVSPASSLRGPHTVEPIPEPCSNRPAETKSLGRSNNFKTEALTSQSAASESHDTQS